MTILANKGTLTACYVYSGFADYFGGHGCADDDDRKEFLLYAYYGRKTKLADIVDQLVDDACNGAASEELPDDITDSDIRDAIMTTALSTRGRIDVAEGAVAECSAAWGADAECACGASLTDVDDGDPCPVCDDWGDSDESPIFVVVLEYTYPADPNACPDYDDKTGCVKCEAYDDCDDREERAETDDSIHLEGMERLTSSTQ
jgi:hypothetical protein